MAVLVPGYLTGQRYQHSILINSCRTGLCRLAVLVNSEGMVRP